MYDLDKISKRIGRRVKEICDEKQITRKELCEATNLARGTISYIYRGKTNPDLYTGI